MSPRLGLALLIQLLPLATASSQAIVRANGIAFDSLSGHPLASAVIFLGNRSTLADSAGRFAFDSLAPGTYRVIMQHDALDSLGLSEITLSVMIRGPGDTIRMSTPSSRTMWRRICPGEQPRDSGFVFGIVRGAARKPVTGAIIAASWIELVSVGRGVVQKGWKLETKSTADGSYAMCGMPVGTGAGLEATLDSTAYAGVQVMLTERSSVRRQDLTMTDVGDSAARGTIRGTVTSEGRALSNVRIETDGMPEVRSGSDGGFIIRNVRAGTRQVYIQSIGFAPEARIVEVVAGDTSTMTVTVGKVTLLDSVHVTAKTARTRLLDQFNDRRRTGLGYYRDSVQLAGVHGWSGVFNGMTSVTVRNATSSAPIITIGTPRGAGQACSPEIWVDRLKWDASALASLRPDDIAAIEVYRPGQIPADLKAAGIGQPRRRGPDNLCAIVIWTKRGTR